MTQLWVLFALFSCDSPLETNALTTNPINYSGEYKPKSYTHSLLPINDLECYNPFAYKWDGTITFKGDTIAAFINFQYDEVTAVGSSNVTAEEYIDYTFFGYGGNYFTISKIGDEYVKYGEGDCDTIIYHSDEFYKHNFTAIFGKDTLKVDLTAPKMIINGGVETEINWQIYSNHQSFSELNLQEDMSVTGYVSQGDAIMEISTGSWKIENDSIIINDGYQDYTLSDNGNSTIKRKRDVTDKELLQWSMGITDSCKMYNTLVMEKE